MTNRTMDGCGLCALLDDQWSKRSPLQTKTTTTELPTPPTNTKESSRHGTEIESTSFIRRHRLTRRWNSYEFEAADRRPNISNFRPIGGPCDKYKSKFCRTNKVNYLLIPALQKPPRHHSVAQVGGNLSVLTLSHDQMMMDL